ncbi:hypothetical protein HDU93_005612, partial [Gonapodya sp. JEL0774]
MPESALSLVERVQKAITSGLYREVHGVTRSDRKAEQSRRFRLVVTQGQIAWLYAGRLMPRYFRAFAECVRELHIPKVIIACHGDIQPLLQDLPPAFTMDSVVILTVKGQQAMPELIPHLLQRFPLATHLSGSIFYPIAFSDEALEMIRRSVPESRRSSVISLNIYGSLLALTSAPTIYPNLEMLGTSDVTHIGKQMFFPLIPDGFNYQSLPRLTRIQKFRIVIRSSMLSDPGPSQSTSVLDTLTYFFPNLKFLHICLDISRDADAFSAFGDILT